MALIGTLRNKMGKIVVGVIMMTLLAFIGTDLIGNSSLLGGNSTPDIGEMEGKTITNAAFQRKVDELSYNFFINTGNAPVQQEIDHIRNQAWNALILQNVYENQFDELGLSVTDEEMVEMVQGNNINSQIQQFFTDPNTGIFSKQNVTNFLASLKSATPQQINSWISFEKSLVPSRLIEKYTNLFAKTVYANKYEAKNEYFNRNANATINYMYVPFLNIPDSSIKVSEKELKTYLKNHASEFEREETRNIEYVSFEMIPSTADTAIIEDEVAELKELFALATNDSSFVGINSDDQLPFITYKEDNLPDLLVDKEIDYISEPTIVNGSYEFYKLSRIDYQGTDSLVYRVAKMKKNFFVSDETLNEIYRQADFFSSSVSTPEEFRKLAQEQGLKISKANRINKNAQRVENMLQARSLVLWLYNDASVGKVSDVKEIENQYVIAVMTGEQKKGVANLDEVKNQVEQKVKNQKKAEIILSKLNELEITDMKSLVSAYGEGAQEGTADFQFFSNSITIVGYAPEVIGLAFSLEEEEITKAFDIQNGIIVMKLEAKDIPEDLDDYSTFAQELQASQRLFPSVEVADFPLSYYRLLVPREIGDAMKKFAEIEDMRYKFF